MWIPCDFYVRPRLVSSHMEVTRSSRAIQMSILEDNDMSTHPSGAWRLDHIVAQVRSAASTLLANQIGASRWRSRNVLWVIPALIGLALALSACGGGSPSAGVASINASGGSKANAAAKKHSTPNALAYAQCMRTHGVSNFPDPNSQGHFSLGSQAGIDKNSPVFHAAGTACQALKPPGKGSLVRQDQSAFLKFSSCMRSHGEPGFPDITATSGSKSSTRSAIKALDPSSPPFQSALAACRSALPSNFSLPSSATSGNSGA